MPILKRATIKDIARVARVSTASVSQALRPRSGSNIKLPEETVDRIKSVALQLNYRPHVGARSIRSKQFSTLGYFVAKTGLFTHTPAGYMAGVHDSAEEMAFRITLIRHPYHSEKIQDSIPSIFTEHNLDALVIESYSELADKIHSHLKDINLPVVFLNDKHKTNSIYVNDKLGAQKLTQYMIDRGHTDIAFILRTHPVATHYLDEMHHSAQDRMSGYEETMILNGLNPVIHSIRSTPVGYDANLTDKQWDLFKNHKSIITYDDDLANMIARYCYNHNIRIPEDLAIGSFNADYGSLCSWRRLTTVKLPSYEMGCQATEMALRLIQSSNREAIPSQSFNPSLVIGETTR